MAERAHATLTRRGREYTDPRTGDVYLSVTSVIGAALGKDFLTKWAAGMSADTMIDEWDRVNALYDADPASARKYVADAAQRHTGRRALIGTNVHNKLEAHLKGLPFPAIETESKGRFGQVTKLTAGDIEEVEMIWAQLSALVARIDLDPVFVEPLVVNRTHGYAGSADIIARSNLWEGVQIVDLKTKPKAAKPYPEVAVQMAAYANGEVILNEDGTETSLAELNINWREARALLASPVGASVFRIDLGGMFSVFSAMQTVSDFAAKGDKSITPVQIVATDTPEDIFNEITQASSVPELTALYYRHAARGKWIPAHTEAAAKRKAELL